MESSGGESPVTAFTAVPTVTSATGASSSALASASAAPATCQYSSDAGCGPGAAALGTKETNGCRVTEPSG